MGLFGLGKKDNFVDLTERYKKQKEKIENIQEESKEEQVQSPGIFGMFGGTNQPAATEENSNGEEIVERKRKLAKRLMDMTDKIEDLSNQIYHLQQRVEILENRNKGDY